MMSRDPRHSYLFFRANLENYSKLFGELKRKLKYNGDPTNLLKLAVAVAVAVAAVVVAAVAAWQWTYDLSRGGGLICFPDLVRIPES